MPFSSTPTQTSYAISIRAPSVLDAPFKALLFPSNAREIVPWSHGARPRYKYKKRARGRNTRQITDLIDLSNEYTDQKQLILA